MFVGGLQFACFCVARPEQSLVPWHLHAVLVCALRAATARTSKMPAEDQCEKCGLRGPSEPVLLALAGEGISNLFGIGTAF